jgi:ATP-dependent DNA helicase DinG
MEHVLGAGGIISHRYSGFEVRPQQLRMAEGVKGVLEEGGHLAVEAGTGVGKSFAYLVPAIRHIGKGGGKVLVSTYTITLQQQLINKDIPFLAEMMDEQFTACLAKGRGNYLCRRRMGYALGRGKGLFGEEAGELAKIADWGRGTEDGSLSDLDFVPTGSVWEAVKSEHGNCRGRKCEHFRECFYQKARRDLQRADIIVANHALMFSDLILKEGTNGIMPAYRHVVIDEAHNIEHVAEDHFGIDISNYTISYLLGSLYNHRTRKGLLAYGDTDGAKELVAQCRESSKVFFAQIQAWYEHARRETNGRVHPDFVSDNMSEQIRSLRLELGRIAKKIDEADDERMEYDRYIEKCRVLEGEIKEFLSQPNEGNVYWVEVSEGRRLRVVLRSAPVDVGPYVKKCLFEKYESVVMTSATLSCGRGEEKEGFEFFAGRIGLEEFAAMKLGSPFDYGRQVKMYIEADMPNPNEAEYEAPAAEAVKKYIMMTDGKAFVLFTSYSMLKKMEKMLEGWLAAKGIQLLVQGGGVDRSVLLEEFKRDERSVLFGTDSFWQGVDVPGESLSNVIIMKLPFLVPSHPLIEGRIEQIRATGESPFFKYQLPTAIIKFKQGFGRLIRTKSDTGIVAVLDSRIVRKSYGKEFLAAVGDCNIEIVTKGDSAD